VKRGFKAEANRKSKAIRVDLGIKYNEALDCFKLVDSLGISIYPVVKLGEYGLTTEQINIICYDKGKQQFSAMTILVSYGYLVFYNQTHSFARTNSSLAHEVSHIILEHEFSLISDIRMISREFEKEKEDEANWMAGCLLLPEEGLIWALREKMSITDIADHFCVSKQMTQWRYNATGMINRIKYLK